MHRIQVRPVELPGGASTIMEAWRHVYRDDPDWAPPRSRDLRWMLDPSRNPYLERVSYRCFVAWRDGRPTGTICAHLPGEGPARFGLFEFTPHKHVARCLVTMAAEWLRDQGAMDMRGPFALGPDQGFGLLVEGFDCAPCVLDAHARPWYPEIYRAVGLQPVEEWRSHWLEAGPVPPMVQRVAERLGERHPEVTVEPLRMARFERDVGDVVSVCRAAGGAGPGLGCDDLELLLHRLRPAVEPRLVWLAREGGRCIGALVAIPDLAPVLRRMHGRMLPFGCFNWAFGRQRTDRVRVLTVVVHPEHRHPGLGAPLYLAAWRAARDLGYRGVELPPLPREDQRTAHEIRRLGGGVHRVYQVYEAGLEAVTEECDAACARASG